MRRLCGVAALATHGLPLVIALLLSTSAFAQSRVEVSAGATWTGGFDAGGSDATLSRGVAGAPLTLFETTPRVDAAPGVVARASFFVTHRLAIEGTADFGRPLLRVTISNDFEHASGPEATNRLSSYGFGGSALYEIVDRRVAPFVLVGAGWMRQLDDEQVMLVKGSELHAGGGVRFRVARHLSLRADAIASSRQKSIAFEQKRRTLPVLSASIGYRF